MDVFGDFEPMCPGFESRRWHIFFFFFFFFNVFIFFCLFLSLLLQCKFANSTLLSLLSFSYLITPYDAQACSAFSALINLNREKDTQKQYQNGWILYLVGENQDFHLKINEYIFFKIN